MSKIMMVHGFVLDGTGSNLYVRNIVKKMCEMGQDVVLVCQEFTPDKYDYISKCIRQKDNDYVVEFERETPYPGKCDIYIPDTHNELLVYVYDRYKDLKVREMKDVSNEEIDAYVSLNASCIQHICETNDISKVYANHLVLQPQYVYQGLQAAKSKAQFNVICHGSDINYAISKNQYLDQLSRVTLLAADNLIAVSQHSKETMKKTYPDLDLERVKVINAGLDESLYGSMDKDLEMSMLSEYIDKHQELGFSSKQVEMIKDMVESNNYDFDKVQESYEPKDVEIGIKDDLFNKMYSNDYERVIYLGKYLEQKGIIPLVLGLPLIYSDNPKVVTLFIGFGALRAKLEYIIQLLMAERFDDIFDNADKLGVTLKEDFAILEVLKENLKNEDYLNQYKKGLAYLKTNTLFTGYFDQKYAMRILAHGNVSIFPSIYVEAFGMVIIEAMASKVTPLVSRHSGFKETLEIAASKIKDLDIKNYSVELDKDMMDNIAKKTIELLSKDNTYFNNEMSTFALANYGWGGITKQLMDI